MRRMLIFGNYFLRKILGVFPFFSFFLFFFFFFFFSWKRSIDGCYGPQSAARFPGFYTIYRKGWSFPVRSAV